VSAAAVSTEQQGKHQDVGTFSVSSEQQGNSNEKETNKKVKGLKIAAHGEGSVKKGKDVSTKSKSSSKSKHSKKHKKKNGVLNLSVGFIKRIARLPLKDRKEILKVLKKQECKRSLLSKASNAMGNSLSISSNTSNSSVNKDWENWVLLHRKKEAAAEDVREIGRSLGVKFNGDINNRFNLLSREGRKELKAKRGIVLVEGDVEEDGVFEEGC